MLSFTCAYLKSHFSAEFLASVISNQGGFYSSFAYMSEARRFGIKILQPDINKSKWKWVGRENTIRMGFMSIRKLKKKIVDTIISERRSGQFKSLNDFLLRVDLDLADAMLITNAGCFRCIDSQLTHRDIAYLVAGFYLQNNEKTPLCKSVKSYDLKDGEYFELELESFGYPISIHPIARYRSIVSSRIKYAKDIYRYIGKSIYLMGIYITKKQTVTRNSKPMEFLTLEDETDIYECVVFPRVFEDCGDILNWETFFIIRGVVEISFGVCNVRIEKIGSLQNWVKKISRQKSSKIPTSL